MALPTGLKTVGELVDVPIDSPMSAMELERLDALESRAEFAFRQQFKAELELGKHFDELKHYPRMLWQRSDVFRTKAGGWKKSRKWHDYVVANGLAESGKEADRLIQLWRDCPYPADPVYLLEMLHSIDTGRIDPERPPWIPRHPDYSGKLGTAEVPEGKAGRGLCDGFGGRERGSRLARHGEPTWQPPIPRSS